MAINSNNALKAKHVCYLAGTGGGKTTAVKLLNMVGDQCAIFDLYGDYKYDGRKRGHFNGLGGRAVYHYANRKQFAQAFVEAWRSGKKFVVAYSPEFPKSLKGEQLKKAKQAELYWFGQLMWEAADGNRELHVVIEELARLSDTAGKDDSIIGELATGGRKFGVILHTVFQRSQEVPKTIWNISPRKVLGAQEAQADAKRVSVELDAELTDIYLISKLNARYEDERLYYLVKSKGGIGNIEPKVIHLKTGKAENLTFDQLRAA
ncbi:hypothetical protein [Pseudoalteromonas maricaloris]|uniref:hypothetical protein n=1 Tax=Pseudoalteromonas maricaloris TaxID=184924 RepID=UPI00068A0BFF|nr:hypothetical protein [Pseudoalteromonas flavipulchra]MBE0372371.1 hypothetical protein [Pseudoalteromonas flavipulchra NCIMB 2033 = ATCC BAA-314]